MGIDLLRAYDPVFDVSAIFPQTSHISTKSHTVLFPDRRRFNNAHAEETLLETRDLVFHTDEPGFFICSLTRLLRCKGG